MIVKPCPGCGGKGTIEVKVLDPCTEMYVKRKRRCFNCNGTGEVQK